MVTFTLSTENVRNTVFTNEPTNCPQHRHSIPAFGRTVTFRKQPKVVAETERHPSSTAKFRFRKIEGETKDFIGIRRCFKKKYVFTGPGPDRWVFQKRVVVIRTLPLA